MDNDAANELRIPPPGGAIGVVIFSTILIVSAGFAAGNLLLWQATVFALVCSAFWLLGLAMIGWGTLQEKGSLRKASVALAAPFAKHFFLRAIDHGGVRSVLYGFYLRGEHIVHGPVAVERIATLGWSIGQGSSMSGEDMGDWSVALWYELETQPAVKKYPTDGMDLIIIGPTGAREDIDLLGRSIAQFLQGNGIEWEVVEDERRRYKLQRAGMKNDE